MIGFNEKQDLSIALPSGVGPRGAGGGSQWTWLQFILGVNQQDSNGKLIPTPVIPGPDWSSIVWNTFILFENPPLSTATGAAVGNLITFDCLGIDGVASAGFQINGTLVYTGPATNCKARMIGGPFVGTSSMTLEMQHSVTGFIRRFDPVVSPEDLTFVIPASVAATITIFGYAGGDLGLIAQSLGATGSITFSNIP